MRNQRHLFLLIVFMLTVLFASSGNAKKTTVYLDNSNLTAYAHEDTARGSYYSLQVPVPDVVKGKKLYGVVLEIHVDADGVLRDDESVKVPVIEVVVLNGSFSGSLSGIQQNLNTHLVFNVPPGEDRRIRVDLTEIVQEHLANSTGSIGLLVGGLSEHRDGNVALRTNVFSGGYLAKVDYHYDARSR